MGIGIDLWRARIGTFTRPVTTKTCLAVLKLYGVSLCIRTLLFLLLAVYGVETNPGPTPGSGHNSQDKSAGKGAASSKGRGRGEPSEVVPGRSLRSNSTSAHSNLRPSVQSPSYVQPRRSPNISLHTHPPHTLAQQPLDNWLASSANAASPGLFGPSRFQSPSHGIIFSTQSDTSNAKLKTIMLTVQASVQNMESKFLQLEKSIQEVKDSNAKLIQSNCEIKDNVKDLANIVETLEIELQASEENRERLEAQLRRENLRSYGIPEDKDETWEETESKVKQYIDTNLEMNPSNLSIKRAYRIQSTERPRPIIAKFSFYKEKEKILKTYREKRKQCHEREREREGEANSDDGRSVENEEHESNFSKEITVCEDYPTRVMKTRNNLRKFLKDALKDNKRAFLRYDKLIIEGDAYVYDPKTENILLTRK